MVAHGQFKVGNWLTVFKDVKLKSGRIPNHVAIISPALDTVAVTGAISTIWVLLVTTKHPQSNATANDIARKCTIEVGYTIYWKMHLQHVEHTTLTAHFNNFLFTVLSY